MTAQEWHTRIGDLESEIAAKTARLMMLGHAKAAAISDAKKLSVLEREELEMPAAIEVLKRRLPLLSRELEDALKVEATERLHALAQAGTEAATQTHASRAAIRLAMQSVLDCISQAHADWNAHGVIVAEAGYLAARFGLAPPQLPGRAYLSPEEQHHFKRQFDLLLRHSPKTQPWAGMLSDFQEARRREESQRRAKEDAALPNTPTYTHWSDGKPLAARRN